jgi:DNA-binding transcriptional ArsR family regulator
LRNPLSIPRTILSPQKIQTLSPQEKDFYIRNVILEILRLNERKGITVSQLSSATGFNRMTISKHLDILVATGEAYKVQQGNVFIFYKNGKLVDEADIGSLVFSDKTYTFYKLENNEGAFMYIQEKELDESRVPQVKGGVMISMKDVPNFLAKMREFAEKAEPEWKMS